jgi:hypothetical protein
MNNIGTFLFQSAATTTGNGELYLTNKADIVTLEITGTATSGTVIFEGLMPSGTYYPVRGIRLSDYSIATQSVAVGELWEIDVTNFVAIRARISAVAGGYITVNSKVVNSNG